MSDSSISAAQHAAAVQTNPDTFQSPSKAARIRANRAEARALTDDPLLTAKESAAEAGVATNTWWKHLKTGRFPAPSYPLPRCPRWRRSEIRAAVTAASSAP